MAPGNKRSKGFVKAASAPESRAAQRLESLLK
jgi:hypothetical protein